MKCLKINLCLYNFVVVDILEEFFVLVLEFYLLVVRGFNINFIVLLYKMDY